MHEIYLIYFVNDKIYCNYIVPTPENTLVSHLKRQICDHLIKLYSHVRVMNNSDNTRVFVFISESYVKKITGQRNCTYIKMTKPTRVQLKMERGVGQLYCTLLQWIFHFMSTQVMVLHQWTISNGIVSHVTPVQ